MRLKKCVETLVLALTISQNEVENISIRDITKNPIWCIPSWASFLDSLTANVQHTSLIIHPYPFFITPYLHREMLSEQYCLLCPLSPYLSLFCHFSLLILLSIFFIPQLSPLVLHAFTVFHTPSCPPTPCDRPCCIADMRWRIIPLCVCLRMCVWVSVWLVADKTSHSYPPRQTCVAVPVRGPHISSHTTDSCTQKYTRILLNTYAHTYTQSWLCTTTLLHWKPYSGGFHNAVYV